jgi:hypothetical protein
MNIIILIIASDNKHEYIKMQELWKSYMNSHPNIKSYFIKMKPDLESKVVLDNDNNIIWIKGKETLIPGVLEKTINSIEYILDNPKFFTFDFIFRTNLSSVLNLKLFYEMVLLDKNNLDYAGVIGYYNKIQFASGAGFIMSKKSCEKIISEKDLLDYKYIDDVAIGFFFNNKTKIYELKRFDTLENKMNIIKLNDISEYYHFRCKSDIKHLKTISDMMIIINLIYF